MPIDDPLLLANDVIEVSYRGTLCGQTTLTVMHYRAKDLIEAHLTDAMDDLHESLILADKQVDKYMASAASNFALNEVVIQAIETVRYARYSYTHDETGGQASPANVADLAAFVEFSTPFVTARKLKLKRGQTGGMHYAPVPSDKMDNGMIQAAYLVANLADTAAILIDPITTALGNEWQPVIFHRGDVAPKWTDISRFSIKPQARVMRRRTVGLGI